MQHNKIDLRKNSRKQKDHNKKNLIIIKNVYRTLRFCMKLEGILLKRVKFSYNCFRHIMTRHEIFPHVF